MSQASTETGPAAFGGLGPAAGSERKSDAPTSQSKAGSDASARALAVRDEVAENSKKGRRKRSRRRRLVGPYGLALIATLAWGSLWGGYIYGYNDEIPLLANFPSAWIAAVLVGALGPVAFFWMLAIIVAQSSKLRRSADALRAMAERLTHPGESAAAEIATVGGAVEQQIGRISHALDQATTRVEKMEVTLEKKVAALDEAGRRARAQTKDMRADLENERQSLAAFAQQLHTEMGENTKSMEGKLSDLSNTTLQAQKEIKKTEDVVQQQLDAFRATLQAMTEGSESAVVEIGRQHDKLHTVVNTVSDRSDEVIQKFEQKRTDLDGMVKKLEGQGTYLDGAITRQREFLGRMTEVLADQSAQLDQALGQSRDKFEEAFAGMMARAGDAGEKFRAETARSVEEGERAAKAITESAENAAAAFKSKTDEAISESDDAAAKFMLRAADLNKKIRHEAATVIEIGEDTATAIRDALSAANQVAEDVRQSMQAQADEIRKGVGDSTVAAEEANAKLISRIVQSKTSAEDLVVHIDKALNALGDAGTRLQQTVTSVEDQSGRLRAQLEDLSKDVERRIAQIPEKASTEATRLRDMFSTEIGQMSALANSVTEEAEKLQLAIRERRQLLIDMHRGMMSDETADLVEDELEDLPRAEHTDDEEQFLGVFKRGQWSPADEDGENVDDEHANEDLMPWPADDAPPPQAPATEELPEGHSPLSRRRATNLPEKGFWQTLFTRIDEEKEAEEAEQKQPAPDGPAEASAPLGDEDFQRASTAIVQNLQAMAIDIDHLLEDTPPIELWQRYQHGEKNVFANRLLSLRTTGLAERIERKYREDQEFRDNADRYVRQFERLLDEAITRDRDNHMADAYLSSQTGKVYLLLGQSIGYFG